ncbi:hypothetical protein [Caballeronia cordobensis]|uniref:hypothetical protein n=1 Tax=Caballeronia cordobensis TaxID=1353886 RepID=UPI000AFA51EC|nr:hypothetical protein [Caballeronia cordobensis]
MYLTHEQRHSLTIAASTARANDRIQAIDAAAEQLRRENPGAFHTDDSLHERVFVHQPSPALPCKAFHHPFPRERATSGV